jgi:4-diphosphocytidyl-2-C-methyl-D-erythritol kinase
VTGRRTDGYHLLDSLAVFPPVGDALHAWPATTLLLAVDGPFGDTIGETADNLVLRAARALKQQAGVRMGARLVLTKTLPVAAGIGGGSADAAATLRLLVRTWNLSLPIADLSALAVALGADVPVCLDSRTARMSGVGERIKPGPLLPPGGIALVNPGDPVQTAEVFAARHDAFSAAADLPDQWHDIAAMAADLRALRNDLQSPAIALCPAIATALAALATRRDCLLARMSGSGATCFGLFPTPEAARQVAEELRLPDWWSWGGALTSS